MKKRVVELGDGRFAVPGNRWDLLADREPAARTISVVIPFYREQHMLELVLAGLAAQTHPRSKLQVVIADDGSPEPPCIPEIARCLAPTIVRQDDHGFRAAAARNLGVQHSDGELIVLLDGDTVPEPQYLQHLSRLPALLPDAVVAGRRRYTDFTGWTGEGLLSWFDGDRGPPDVLDEPQWLIEHYRRSTNLLKTEPRSFTYLIGAVLACSRTMYTEIGGFDETFVGYGGEDYDFTYRAWNAGAVLGYVPEAVAWHQGPDWSGRVPDRSQQRSQKNVEALALARKIPEPSFRAAGQWYQVCDFVVEINCTGWSLAAAVVSIQSLLSVLDCGVWLVGDDPSTIADAFHGDPRVRCAAVGPAYPGRQGIGARARARMNLTVPIVADARFGRRVNDMLAADIGRLTVHEQEQPVATITSTRAGARAARWDGNLGGDREALLGQLFDVDTVPASEIGLEVIKQEPSLPAVFGGWA
jgi:GT2 family glycosyltransferase